MSTRVDYDAVRTVEAFSARLRDEVDVDTLTGELPAVVDQTAASTKVSLWLRSQAPPRQRLERSPEDRDHRPLAVPELVDGGSW